jgi:hypothetical protein
MNSIESDDAFGTILVRVVNAPLLIFVGWIGYFMNSIESDDAFGTIKVRVVNAPFLILVGWIGYLGQWMN